MFWVGFRELIPSFLWSFVKPEILFIVKQPCNVTNIDKHCDVNNIYFFLMIFPCLLACSSPVPRMWIWSSWRVWMWYGRVLDGENYEDKKACERAATNIARENYLLWLNDFVLHFNLIVVWDYWWDGSPSQDYPSPSSIKFVGIPSYTHAHEHPCPFNNETCSPQGLRANSPWDKAEWAIDPRPLRAKGLIVLVSPN